MKKNLLNLPLLIIAFVYAIAASGQDTSIRVMSFNIRLDNSGDGINRWENRKQIASGAIVEQDLDFAGMQEVLNNQMKDLEALIPGYGHIGAGREDGKTKGEAVPIFYKFDRFELLDNGTFWLSATPGDTGSVGWDAALPRICTWGKFFDRSTKRQFYVLNTHFDHMGRTARAESARLIIDFITKHTYDFQVILTGDFNSPSEDEPYSVLTNTQDGMSDVCQSINSPNACNEGTFNGFGNENDPQRIDMVFFKGRWEVVSYEVLKIKKGEVLISDHWPVVAELKIKN